MKKFARVICSLFICMFAFLSVGCIGADSDFHQELIDMYERGEITLEELQDLLNNSMSAPMFGTKVLYRPDHYDYDGAVGEGNEEYYGQYAWDILRYLTYTFGTVTDNTYIPDLDYYNNISKKFYYDSIRYNIFSQEDYNTKIYYEEDASGSVSFNGKKYTQIKSETNFSTISVNTANSWNWTLCGKFNPQGWIYENDYYGFDLVENGNIVQNSFNRIGDTNEYFNRLDEYYNNSIENRTNYITNYIGTETQTEIENYTDFVKALEYVIYNFTMNLTPADISITLNADGSPSVKIGNFPDVDSALEYIKQLFDKVGTYVGISSTTAEKLKTYILENVIGEKAINNDSVVISYYDTVNVYKDADGSEHVSKGTLVQPPQTIKINRDYETVVDNIVDAIYKDVQIGSESDDTINNRYPASEIIDYYGNNFYIASNDPFKNIKPLEYQSAVLMFKEKVTIDNIMLHFKYDAGLDGDEIFDSTSSITINVYINFYDHSEKKYYDKLVSESITVKDGAFEYGNENSTLCLFGIAPVRGPGIEIEPFNTEIGNGILKGMEYNATTSISDPIKLIGTTKVKDYYRLVEPDASTLDQNVYYSYGILNQNMFEIDGGSDYLEIAYEVIKTTGDFDTNYKFYTGLSLIA